MSWNHKWDDAVGKVLKVDDHWVLIIRGNDSLMNVVLNGISESSYYALGTFRDNGLYIYYEQTMKRTPNLVFDMSNLCNVFDELETKYEPF